MAVKNNEVTGKKHIAVPIKKNYWKLVAVLFTFLFAVLLIFGLVRAYHFKSSFSSATAEQVKIAQELVSFELKKNGENIFEYDVHIFNKIKHVQRKNISSNILQVSLKKDLMSQVYLIDVDKKFVVLHSRTEFYGDTINLEHPRSSRDFGIFSKFRGIK